MRKLTDKDKKYIKENRLKMSMVDMAKEISSSYNRVRNYMLESDLMLTKNQINEIKKIKRSKPNFNWLP